MKSWIRPSVSELDIRLTESGSISLDVEGEPVYLTEQQIFIGYSSEN